MNWYEQVSAHGVSTVARMLGLRVGATTGNVNRAIAPCPSCGAERRGRRDRRGPIGIRPDDRGWRCHRCDAHGDPVHLAAWVLLGVYKPSGSRWREVQAGCAEVGLCDGPSPGISPRPARRTVGACSERSRFFPGAREHPAIRPPSDEVVGLWKACRSVVDDADVAAWLAARGLEPELCAMHDVVRALPPDIRLPDWARFGRPWTESGHRVVVPMYGPRGDLETLHARALAPRDPKGRDKAASPKGAQVAGTLMANQQGLHLLFQGTTGASFPTDTTCTLQRPTILIAEGVPDFVTWATHYRQDDPAAPAVLGIIAGSWSEAIAERIPDGACVLIRTHDDKAGHKYAQRIGETLRDRCQVYCRAVKDET